MTITIDEIKSAIERRGYSVQVNHYQRSVDFRISAGERSVMRAYARIAEGDEEE